MNSEKPGDHGSKNGRTPDPERKVGGASPVPTPPPNEDAEVDLGQLPPVEGSGVVGGSRSQLSGPLSGTSIVSWADLMKTRSEVDINLDEPDSIDFDSPSDRDLVERIRAEEAENKAHENILEPSADALPVAGISEFISDEPESALFAPHGASHKGDESSQVNLLSDLEDDALDSSKRLPPTDHVSPINATVGSGDSGTDIGAMPIGGEESSAVDLGSESFVDLPHPLPGGSSLKPGKSRSKTPGSSVEGDSGTVDLLGSKREGTDPSSIPGLTAVGSSLRPDSAMPSTAKISVERSPWRGRVVNGLVGAAAGVAACAGLYFSGLLPQPAKSSDAVPTEKVSSVPPANDAAIAQNQANLDELKKLQTTVVAVRDAIGDAKLSPEDFSTAIAKLTRERESATAEAEKTRTAAQAAAKEKSVTDAQLQTAKDSLAQAMADQKKLEDELKQTRQQMAATKPATDDPAEVAKLKQDREKLIAKAEQLEEQLSIAQKKTDEATKALQESASFATSVREKLQTPADSTNPEVLSALERAVAGKGAEPVSRTQYPPPYAYNPQAERFFNNGLKNLRAGSACDAEQDFQAAVGLNDRDARYWYFLGLAKIAQGQGADAEFLAGVDLERRNLPNPSQMNAALERMPLEVRQVMSQVRGR